MESVELKCGEEIGVIEQRYRQETEKIREEFKRQEQKFLVHSWTPPRTNSGTFANQK